MKRKKEASMCGNQSGSRSRYWMIGLALMGVSACDAGGEGDQAVGLTEGALTAEQCSFFGVNDKVNICHHTGSTKKPYQVIRTNVASCGGHALHEGDYVTSLDPASPLYDPTCNQQGCFPEGAPFDGTVDCCDYLWPDETGHCAQVVCPADSACTTYMPDAQGGGCTAEREPAGTSCDDGLVTTIDTCNEAGGCGSVTCEGASCTGTGLCAYGSQLETVRLGGVSFTVPSGAPELHVCSLTTAPPTQAANGATIVARSPVFDFGPSPTSFGLPLPISFDVGGEPDLSVFWAADGTNFVELDGSLAGDLLTIGTDHFTPAFVGWNPCAGKSLGAVCGTAPVGQCTAAPTCQGPGPLKCRGNVAPAGVVADYGADFQGTTPKAGWAYYRNDAGVPIGSSPTAYTRLIWDSVRYGLNDDPGYPDGSFSTGPFQALMGTGGISHPGRGVTQDQTEDHFVIAAFTVAQTGTYSIANGWLKSVASSTGLARVFGVPASEANGHEIRVFLGSAPANPKLDIQTLVPNYTNAAAGQTTAFSTPLGCLTAGETIYVAVGPDGFGGADSFDWDFKIVRQP